MKNKGQTLLEVIISTGIISVAIVAILGLVLQSFIAGAESKQRTQATFLAQEAIEKILAIRNVNAKAIKAGSTITWDLDFYEDVPGKRDGYYTYPTYIDASLPLKLTWRSASQVDDTGTDYIYDGITFTRYIQILKRGGSANEREVNVKVTWPSSEGTGEVYLSSVITKLP